jgi:hypothetical protein
LNQIYGSGGKPYYFIGGWREETGEMQEICGEWFFCPTPTLPEGEGGNTGV